MQAGRSAAGAMKEKASNAAASARAGMEKTKATAEEKKERMTAHNPMEKDMATEKKEERMTKAEMDKQMAQEHNAAARLRQAGATTGGQGRVPLHSTGGATGIHHPSYGTTGATVTTGGTATRDVNYGRTTTDGSGI